MTDPTNNCDPTEQLARQQQMEDWYEADGRHDPTHPQHGFYTGLRIADLRTRAAALNPEPAP
jgi:hypothetical protein